MNNRETREIESNANTLAIALLKGNIVDIELKNGFTNSGFVMSVSKVNYSGRKDYQFSFTEGNNLIFKCYSSQIKLIEQDI